MAGSQDLFGSRDRGPIASMNFVAAHDGFTSADLTRYNAKHNGPNGEGNSDGSDNNRSWNHGIEGPVEAGPDGEAIEAGRRRSMRNLMASTLLATGVPMLNAGDEIGRTQGGNNNPYCQDNEVTWVDWELDGVAAGPARDDPLPDPAARGPPRAAPAHLLHRARGPRRTARRTSRGSPTTARPMANGHWEDPATRTLLMLLNGAWFGHRSVLVLLHGGSEHRHGDPARGARASRHTSCSGTRPTRPPAAR